MFTARDIKESSCAMIDRWDPAFSEFVFITRTRKGGTSELQTSAGIPACHSFGNCVPLRQMQLIVIAEGESFRKTFSCRM